MMDKKKKKPMASYKAGGKVKTAAASFKPCPGCKTKRACAIASKCMKKVYG